MFERRPRSSLRCESPHTEIGLERQTAETHQNAGTVASPEFVPRQIDAQGDDRHRAQDQWNTAPPVRRQGADSQQRWYRRQRNPELLGDDEDREDDESVLIEHLQALEIAHLSHAPRRVKAVSPRHPSARTRLSALHALRCAAARSGCERGTGRHGGRHDSGLAPGHPDLDEFTVVWRNDGPRYAQNLDISVAHSARELSDYPANTTLPKGRSSIRWRRASPASPFLTSTMAGWRPRRPL